MDVRIEAVLSAAGVDVPEDSVEVLRDGSPWYVLRARPPEGSLPDSVIVKTCPLTSREPEITAAISGLLECVPRVLRVACGTGFRVMVLEDFGSWGLYENVGPEGYMQAVQALAGIHRRFEGAHEGWSTISQLVPTYGRHEWASTIEVSVSLTQARFSDGTYRISTSRDQSRVADSLEYLVQPSLATLYEVWGHGLAMPSTLVHGDFHEGNILVRDSQGCPRLGIIDWGDARRDSGLFDLVSLVDVARRMKTLELDEGQVLNWYLAARNDSLPQATPKVQAEWNLAWLLRAWGELRWFAESGEDFGERADREIGIIETRLAVLLG